MSSIPQLVPGGARYRLRRVFEYVQSVTMRGDRFTCPCCHGKFRALLPAGVARRPNARCPRCSSLERHRLIWLYLQQQTDFFTLPYKVLDVAPEEFLQRKLKALPNISYLSIDLESGLAMKKMDVTKLDLPDNSYDVIFCNHVFEHIPDDRAAMRELHRVLKPGGWAILQTPIDLEREMTDEDASVTDPQERLRRFGQTDHIRIYGRDFFDRLRQAGWTVDRNRFVASFKHADIQRYALDPKEELFIGHK
jgi:SAM-dependent methyltransferase